MPRHCIIEFNNPITGQRQTSLLGYILNQQGINVNDVNALLQDVYQAKASQGSITQDSTSFYRGQIERPTIDSEGNLVLYGREDELYKKAGLPSKGVSMSDNLGTAIEYGLGQYEVAQNLASETYDAEQLLTEIGDNGYFLIQISKDIPNEIVSELGEVKIIGDTLVIPKGQYKVEQIIDGEETPINLLATDSVVTSQATRSWGSNNNISSDFIEPRVTDLANEFNLEIAPGLADQINLIQDFYDSKNIHLGTNLNLLEAKDIIKDAQDLDISLELEAVNPEDQPSDRMYRVYPVSPGQANNEAVNNFIYQELNAYYQQVGAPNALTAISNYVDVTNPTLVGMLKNILNDPSTTQFEKDIMNTMLSLLRQFPEINVNFSKDLMLSELNPDNLVPAKYEAKTNTITLYTGPLSNYNAGQFKHILLHELTHALFFSTLKNPQTAAEKVFASEIKRIYDYYRTKFPNAAYIGEFYGLSNEHEFLSEFFSNPEFRAILEKEAPPVHGSIFQSVLNFFKKLFNQFLVDRNRQDTQYLNDLTKYFFNNVLNSKINTSAVYVSEDAFNYEVTDQVYNDFLKSIPGKDSFDKFYGALESLLNNPKINWQSIFKHAKATGIQLKVLTESVDVLQNIEVGALTRSD